MNKDIGVLEIADMIRKRVVRDYCCSPQIVTNGGSVGFNVGAREVGRVRREGNGDIYEIYYVPGSQLATPVFC